MKARELFDTCILIDYLNGHVGAREEIDGAREPAISHITWIEVMVGTTEDDEVATRRFLDRFAVLELTQPVGARSIGIRQGKASSSGKKKPKLPDAIVFATALEDKRVLVTRNTNDFPAATPGVRVPYSPVK